MKRLVPIAAWPARRMIRCIAVTAVWAVMAGRTPALSVVGAVPPEVRIIEGAKTFHVEMEGAQGPAGEVHQPFAAVVGILLRNAGKEEAPADKADLIVHIHAEGTPLSREYNDVARGGKVRHYTGARLEGYFELRAQTQPPVRKDFSGIFSPPFRITVAAPEPTDAPFGSAFGGFVEQFTGMVALACGPKPLLAVLALPEAEGLVYEVPSLQTAVAGQIGRLRPPTAREALLAALQSSVAHRQAAAARGLLALADGSVYPELIAQLHTGDEDLDKPDPNGQWARLTGYETAFESEEDPDGFLALRPELLKALLRLYVPDRLPLLVEALADKDSVMRRLGAALVLGHTKDRSAVEPLIGALGDPHDFVRTGAARALGALGDKRAVPALQKLARQEDEGPDKYAALDALEQLGAPEPAPKEPK